jgi:hypothetical protein
MRSEALSVTEDSYWLNCVQLCKNIRTMGSVARAIVVL